MMHPYRKVSDEEIHILVNEGNIPVDVVAKLLDTSRGHIYRCLQRYADPVDFMSRERAYRAERKARGLRS